MSDFKYSKEKIDKMIADFKNDGAGKVALRGCYDDLLKLESEIENFYEAYIFYLDSWEADAPYFGFSRQFHEEAYDRTAYVTREISKKFLEIYALILIGLGKEDNWKKDGVKK